MKKHGVAEQLPVFDDRKLVFACMAGRNQLMGVQIPPTPLMMTDCVFCKIAKGEIPSYKVYEDSNMIAFLDIKPYAIGHVLVIPKKHSAWVWDMNKEEYSKLMEKIHYLANVLRKTFDTEWVEEIIAGIGVSHSHIHLLPRQRNDDLGEIPIKPLKSKPSEKELKEITEKIRKNL